MQSRWDFFLLLLVPVSLVAAEVRTTKVEPVSLSPSPAVAVVVGSYGGGGDITAEVVVVVLELLL